MSGCKNSSSNYEKDFLCVCLNQVFTFGLKVCLGAVCTLFEPQLLESGQKFQTITTFQSMAQPTWDGDDDGEIN